MVRIHSPVLSDTPSARDRVGMRGAPRLDTTAISDPDATSVGTRSRRRAGVTFDSVGSEGRLVPASSSLVFQGTSSIITGCHHPMTSGDDECSPVACQFQ